MLRTCSCKSTPGHTYRCEVCGGVGHDFDDVNQAAVTPVTQIPSTQTPLLPTGMDAVDEVLGGGVVEGAVYLLGGEPGIGKSTLLLQVAGGLLSHGKRVLYVSAEETAERVRERCERLGLLDDNLLVTTEAEVGRVLSAADDVAADVLMLDSIQRLHDDGVDKPAGCPSQIRQVCERILDDKGDLTVFVVGHVTKGGSLAGPKFLEHMVDVVMQFSRGDDDGRVLATRKNRFYVLRQCPFE